MTRSRPQGRIAALAVVLVVSTMSQASANSVQPFFVPPERITSRVETVVIEPVSLSNFPTEQDPLRLRQAWATIIGEAFTDLGYEVIASDQFDRVWRETAARMGGLFDPVTGEVADDRLQVVREHTLAELARVHGVDASVRARIAVAPMQTYEKPFGGGFFVGHEAVTWSDGQYLAARPQRVVGPYLDLAVVDAANVPLYGIRARVGWWRVYANRDYFDRPAEAVYFDRIRNLQALGVALEKFPARALGVDRPDG